MKFMQIIGFEILGAFNQVPAIVAGYVIFIDNAVEKLLPFFFWNIFQTGLLPHFIIIGNRLIGEIAFTGFVGLFTPLIDNIRTTVFSFFVFLFSDAAILRKL